jgi:septal ring-binding cell division protein DamX
MTENSFASLSPALLARKGGAKPAMRPQSSLPGNIDNKTAAASLEDLGWNDMGPSAESASEKAPEKTPEKTPMPRAETPASNVAVLQTAKTAPTAIGAASSPASAKRAAFTLRLDPERHLRLRLASTVRNCSAQQFVTEALDQMLEDMPEIETLAAQVKRD